MNNTTCLPLRIANTKNVAKNIENLRIKGNCVSSIYKIFSTHFLCFSITLIFKSILTLVPRL